MNLEEMETKIKALEAKVQSLDDIEEIKQLQKKYGYYMDYGMWDQIIDLFSDNAESVEAGDNGLFLGKEGVKRFFKGVLGRKYTVDFEHRPRGWMAYALQLQSVITPAPDGQTAKGRWYVLMMVNYAPSLIPKACWGFGVYENEYVKENGNWKFKKLHFNRTFITPFDGEGWVRDHDISRAQDTDVVAPDSPPTAYHPYPSGYILPLHFKNPISGQ
jgi:hypothetical protein